MGTRFVLGGLLVYWNIDSHMRIGIVNYSVGFADKRDVVFVGALGLLPMQERNCFCLLKDS